MSRLEQIEAMLGEEPQDVFLNFSLAMELASAGRPAEALPAFDHVLELDPKYHVAYLRKGLLLIDLGRLEEARRALTAGAAVAVECGDHHAADQMTGLLATIRGS